MQIILAVVLGSPILASSNLEKPPTGHRSVISANVPPPLRFKITSGLKRAHRALAHDASCRELFLSLGAHGEGALDSLRFRVATEEQQHSICLERSAALFMDLHGHQVSICPQRFLKVQPRQVAVFLLHEALHSAGLEEHPHRSGALQSFEVTSLVRRECRL